MIRFALVCDQGHEFDAWFASGDSYQDQAETRAVICPSCGSRGAEGADGARRDKAARRGEP